MMETYKSNRTDYLDFLIKTKFLHENSNKLSLSLSGLFVMWTVLEA